MLAKILLPLLAASLAVASPVEQARDASPVAAAAAATSSTPAKGSFEYITYFASTECEFTSSTSNINANVCTNIGDGEIPGESFAFAFASGQSSCKLEIFSKPNCKGSTVKKIAASKVSVANTCSTATGESVKLVC
ncbi:hypothetical protein LTR27_002033 [Elasticomyces elasticus]|nr:hypothetical protein LTR27_002033 [Elasticomyces elasticus]